MILTRYILKNHFIPFLFANVTLMCIFLLQFLMKFADRLVGKGLDTWTIVQLVVFNLSWMFVLVVPMSTLVATLMAYGNMSQNNEVTIMKSSGISLYKMMIPALAASIVVAFLLFEFNNEVLPDANHQAKMLMQDISQKKPTLSLEPGVFSQEVYNYAILSRQMDQKENKLFDVTIYDYSNPSKINVVTAEEGKIFFSEDRTKLMMDLTNGEIHESEIQNTSMYRKLEFSRHRITMDAEQFSFRQSGIATRGEREMSVEDMNYVIDSLRVQKAAILTSLYEEVDKYMFNGKIPPFRAGGDVKPIEPDVVYIRTLEKIRMAKNIVNSTYKRIEWQQREIEKYEVEVYKKYALPAACIVFILIGAPLGVMVRKGGFGTAASISLFFFLLYWAFLIGGEKLAERGFFSPFIGMWAANIVLTIAGIILTIKTNRELTTISFDFIKKYIPKFFTQKEPNSENQNS
ncbi:MAG: LptF/LptG family permease [Ignavibacteriaceae bacterium]|nr:LptF/LptG family permease [Ignavibacteriaceae bacterium]